MAHGISSIIGSYHFVFQDEGGTLPDGEQSAFDNLPEEQSHLFLAIGGVLAVAGVLPPATSAMLHNVSTLGIGLHSMTNLLE